MITSSSMEDIKLPPLPINDIAKLDHLFSFMKENNQNYINIYSFCKEKWGDNRLLYLSFAEYLKINSFTSVQDHNNEQEYVWKQMIAPSGLAIDSFKKEHVRQLKKKKKETLGKSNRLKVLTNIAGSAFFITSLIISFLCSTYLFYNGNKSGIMMKQLQPFEDSLHIKRSLKAELYSSFIPHKLWEK